MSLRTPTCPSCTTALVLTTTGSLDAWSCPMMHGVAVTLNEAHGQLQNDEIAQIWKSTRESSGGTRPCPICSLKMSSIEVAIDADEAAEDEAGDGPTTGTTWLDVCEPCQLLWFDTGEIEQFPADLPDAEPTLQEVSAVAAMTEQFGNAYVEAVNNREAGTFTERVYRVVAQHPGALRTLSAVGRLGRD